MVAKYHDCYEVEQEIEELKTQNQKDIVEFLEGIKTIIKEIEYDNKNGTWNKDIENNTKDKQFWEGYRYGITSILTDYLIEEREKWEGRKNEHL